VPQPADTAPIGAIEPFGPAQALIVYALATKLTATVWFA